MLTFEELAALWDAAGISLNSAVEESASDSFTAWGQGFCKTGGVGAAVKHAVHEGKMKLPGRRREIHTASGAGIAECIQRLKQLEEGELDVDFFEGMGCEGGCLGGPGTLVETKASTRALARTLKQGEN